MMLFRPLLMVLGMVALLGCQSPFARSELPTQQCPLWQEAQPEA